MSVWSVDRMKGSIDMSDMQNYLNTRTEPAK